MLFKTNFTFAYVVVANTLCILLIQWIYVSCESMVPCSCPCHENDFYGRSFLAKYFKEDNTENNSGIQAGSNDSNKSGELEEQPDHAEDEKWRLALANNTFPDRFWFGVTTSAYQAEGAWNVDGKGPSVWDVMTHREPDFVADKTNGDEAVDFYHKFELDILNAKKTGANMFILSLSWSRLLPEGYTTKYNEKGIAYYHKMIDTIIENNMEPMVMLFHWDLPYQFEKLGGAGNPNFVDWFYDYARFAFGTFGSKVKLWVTFAESNSFCLDGYGGVIIPAVNQSGIADYLCGHYLILAHARVYRMYKREFYKEQKGSIGIGQTFIWFEAKNSSSEADIRATENAYHWSNNWLTQPILGDGNYPKAMREQIDSKSKLQGYSRSRLPHFTGDQRRLIQGSADFIGLSHLLTGIICAADEDATEVSFENDANMRPMLVSPKNADGFGKVLRRFQSDYKEFRGIYIIQNGSPDIAGLEDWSKVHYFKHVLTETMKCLQENITLRGYSVWSFTDVFEWSYGYRFYFGLYQVNRYDGSFSRTPRLSQKFIADVYELRYIRNLDEIYGYNCSLLP